MLKLCHNLFCFFQHHSYLSPESSRGQQIVTEFCSLYVFPYCTISLRGYCTISRETLPSKAYYNTFVLWNTLYNTYLHILTRCLGCHSFYSLCLLVVWRQVQSNSLLRRQCQICVYLLYKLTFFHIFTLFRVWRA